MRFLMSLFFLLLLVGVPGAKADSRRPVPYEFAYTVPANRLAYVPPSVVEEFRASVRAVLQQEAGVSTYPEEFAVFTEYSDTDLSG